MDLHQVFKISLPQEYLVFEGGGEDGYLGTPVSMAIL